MAGGRSRPTELEVVSSRVIGNHRIGRVKQAKLGNCP